MQAAREGHSIKALVKISSESQALQVARQVHTIKTLVELPIKSQALQVVWKDHLIKLFVEMHTENQDFQAFREAIRRWNRGAPSYPCHPLQRKLFLRDLESLEVFPSYV